MVRGRWGLDTAMVCANIHMRGGPSLARPVLSSRSPGNDGKEHLKDTTPRSMSCVSRGFH
jgi:hypothetical protein